MSRKDGFLKSGAAALCLFAACATQAHAQVGFGATPGYPSVSQFGVGGGVPGLGVAGGFGAVGYGATGYGDLGFGGFGTTPYSYPGATAAPIGGVVNGLNAGGAGGNLAGGGVEGVANALGATGFGGAPGVGGGIGGGGADSGLGIGGVVGGGPGYGGGGIGVGDASGVTGVGLGYNPAYSVANGQPALGVGGVTGANAFYAAQPRPVQQTALSLQPLYNAINAVPGLNQPAPSRRASRARYHNPPLPPRSQMMSDDGTIYWPSMTPDDQSVAGSRSAVDSAVKGLVVEAKQRGQASTRSVIEAKNKLHAFTRLALPKVAAVSSKDERTLELFVVHLAKTLEHFVNRY